MSKITLKIVAIVMTAMGIAVLVPSWTWSAGPEWYGIVKIALGVIAFGIASSDKS